jgi:23S rRNA pseudouridine1911/1915/1917 synthase
VSELSTVGLPEPGAEGRVVEHVARLRVDGVRLDQYLVSVFPDFSRSVVQRVIDAGGVVVNGRVAKASYKVRHGDVIRVTPPEPTHPAPVAEDIPLDVLYQDEHLAVVNKPADMVVHPAKGHWSGTLVNALRHHFPTLSGLNGDYRAGIVHRLDRDTSGAILIAKDEQTHRDLSALFEARKVFKGPTRSTAAATGSACRT